MKRRVLFLLLGGLRRAARWLPPSLRVPGWVPMLGDIDGRVFARSVVIRGRFGRSMSVPTILEIDVNGSRTRPRAMTLAAERLFDGYPRFVVNVCFSCGSAPLLRSGVYANPHSQWFNVFVGYYQVDAPRSAWSRPFGYRPRPEGGFEVSPEELLRLGKADWNYFSNYIYGVPEHALLPYNEPDGHARVSRIRIAGRTWDQVEVQGMHVASAYLSHRDGERLVNPTWLLSELWRCAFGQPYRGTGNDPPQSFFATPLGARLVMCYRVEQGDRDLGEPVWRTFIFGGTVNEYWAGEDPTRLELNGRFLEHQMQAVMRLIARDFPHLGFDPEDDDRPTSDRPAAEPTTWQAPLAPPE